jgi:hypothetical protein
LPDAGEALKRPHRDEIVTNRGLEATSTGPPLVRQPVVYLMSDMAIDDSEKFVARRRCDIEVEIHEPAVDEVEAHTTVRSQLENADARAVTGERD